MVTIEEYELLGTDVLLEMKGGYCGGYAPIAYGLGGPVGGYLFCSGYDNKYREMQRNYGR